MPFRRHSDPFRGGFEVSGRVELGSGLYPRLRTSFSTWTGSTSVGPSGLWSVSPISNPIPPPVTA